MDHLGTTLEVPSSLQTYKSDDSSLGRNSTSGRRHAGEGGLSQSDTLEGATHVRSMHIDGVFLSLMPPFASLCLSGTVGGIFVPPAALMNLPPCKD